MFLGVSESTWVLWGAMVALSILFLGFARWFPKRMTERADQEATGSEALRQREGDQLLPTQGQQNVSEAVRADLDARIALGIQRYGKPLQTFNGRDALRDAYEEALDLVHYLKQAILERDNPA